MASALSIKKLSKIYQNGFQALSGIDLEIPEGSFYALLGPNGAGKSTTIGIATGLIRATSGSVSVCGHDILTDPVNAKACIGIVPQEFNFSIFETLIDIITTQAGYYGISRSESIPKAEQLLKDLWLYDKRNQPARNLSGGMKRRLMIARALIHNPRVLILDEPTAWVDIELRRGMWDFLRGLSANGVTIILTTHYLEEAESLCDRVAIINKWQIVRDGSMKEVLGGLDAMTYVLEMRHEISQNLIKTLADFSPVKQDNSLEITISKDHTFEDAVACIMSDKNSILSLRTKTNRLEDLFLKLTSSTSQT